MSSKMGYNPTLGPGTTGSDSQKSLPINANGMTSIPGYTSSSSSQIAGQQQKSTPSQSLSTTIPPTNNIMSSVYDRNLHRQPPQVSLSSLSFLFMKIVSRNFTNSKTLPEVERKLNNMGYSIGIKYLELTSLRVNFNNSITSSGKSNVSQRQINVIELLHFITHTIWNSIFNKPADNLEKSTEDECQYMIIDNNPLFSKYITNGIPQEYSNLNCESFVAGMIEGILDSSYFKCEVSAHHVPIDKLPLRTIYLIKFDKGVIIRESRLNLTR